VSPEPLWASIACYGACDVTYDDDWPELPRTPAALRAWISEHGCPFCGSLDVEVEDVGGEDGEL
jgi:hypothetical protein